jgi:hypothetical protein
VKNGTTNMNILGFDPATDCTNLITGIAVTDRYYLCYFVPNETMKDSTFHNISITYYDNAGNSVTNVTNFTINTTISINASLIASDTVGIADGTYENGWSFTFNISMGTGGNALRFRMYDWTDASGNTMSTFNNTKMVYYNSTGVQSTYWVRSSYDETQTVYALQDIDSVMAGTQGNITIYVKIPVGTVSGSYSTSYGVGLYSV